MHSWLADLGPMICACLLYASDTFAHGSVVDSVMTALFVKVGTYQLVNSITSTRRKFLRTGGWATLNSDLCAREKTLIWCASGGQCLFVDGMRRKMRMEYMPELLTYP